MSISRVTESADVQSVLDDAHDKSEKILCELRSVADEVFGNDPDLIVGVNGSVARREVTSGSDVDLFVLTRSGDMRAAKERQAAYRAGLVEKGIKMPANGGVFEDPLRTTSLASTIGGEDDTNTYITRRMLYLLEGEWVANKDGFDRLRADLVARYVPSELEDYKITRFFVNDVIRYWRTICVDFEHKTADAAKPRAIRLIKLRLSRMLLYVGGIAAAKETVGIGAEAKRLKLIEMLALPPLQRLKKVYDSEQMASAFACYATFLSAINNEEVRKKLELPGSEGMDTDEYKILSEVAREFKYELLEIIYKKQVDDHDTLLESIIL